MRSKRFRLVSEQRKTEERGTGFSVLDARELKREPKNERGGGGEEGRFPTFLPHPFPLFYPRIFRAVVLCSETAWKRLLRRLSEAQVRCSSKTYNNGPFPSSKTSQFQNEAKCKTFLVKMRFIYMRINDHFHINNFYALSLAL